MSSSHDDQGFRYIVHNEPTRSVTNHPLTCCVSRSRKASRVMIKEIQAKTLLSTATYPGALFGIKYTMNLYRGCQHQCRCSHHIQHAGSTIANSVCLTPDAVASRYCFDAVHVAVAMPMQGGLLVLSHDMND